MACALMRAKTEKKNTFEHGGIFQVHQPHQVVAAQKSFDFRLFISTIPFSIIVSVRTELRERYNSYD